VGNSNEIGKVYQVIEKWVFFKLLFANLTDSSGGKNHNYHYYPEMYSNDCHYVENVFYQKQVKFPF
jgi:hypothetical protein